MKAYASIPRDDKEKILKCEKEKYEALKARNIKLDISRGKPSKEQLALSEELLKIDISNCADDGGIDIRNYGGLPGIPAARALFGELLGVPASQVQIGGSSSITLMHDTIMRNFLFGALNGDIPWKDQKVKFICPVPGYDRHFTICEAFGIEMINVDMLSTGPDMDKVEELVKDPAVKGIWCVPQYDNPGGVVYSSTTVERLAKMQTAARDFRIFWDNAYCVHHFDVDNPMCVDNIYELCKDVGNEDRVYMFTSTSKITFPNGGVCCLAASPANIAWQREKLNSQVISFDKVNQMRHVRFLANKAQVLEHMRRHATIMKPKFDFVVNYLNEKLGGTDCAVWSMPHGGYFISFFAHPGCAKRIVELCRQAGLILTDAGATYPYHNDPADSNIRIAPSIPTLTELSQAMELFVTVVKLVTIEKLLDEE